MLAALASRSALLRRLPWLPGVQQAPAVLAVRGRGVHTSSVLRHGSNVPADAPPVTMTFVDTDGKATKVTARAGQHVLEVAHANGIDLEGACEASLACSTCHVIVHPDWFDQLPEPSEEEEDMLDLAFGLTTTSRLGCQVELTTDLDGLTVTLPSATRNFAVDGYVPKPH